MIAPSYCWRFGCKHYTGVVGDEPNQVHTCEAFPEGIPEPINLGDEFHSEEVDGDHGIVFEADPYLSADQLNERMFGDV